MGTLSPRCPAPPGHFLARRALDELMSEAAGGPGSPARLLGGRAAAHAAGGGVVKRNVVMSDAGWIYGAAHVRPGLPRSAGTKTRPGPASARLGLNKNPLITGSSSAGRAPASGSRDGSQCRLELCRRPQCQEGQDKAQACLPTRSWGLQEAPSLVFSSVKWGNYPQKPLGGSVEEEPGVGVSFPSGFDFAPPTSCWSLGRSL